jgi:hypothetical protein
MKKIILTVSVLYLLATGIAVSAHSQNMKSAPYYHDVTSTKVDGVFVGRTPDAVNSVLSDDGRELEVSVSDYSLNGNSCVPY